MICDEIIEVREATMRVKAKHRLVWRKVFE